MRYIPLALAGLLVATGAFAQAAPPPSGSPSAIGTVPPPLPSGPPGEAAVPPQRPDDEDARFAPPSSLPRGASVRFERGPGSRFDLHCAEADMTRTCADIALQVIAKLNTPVQIK